MNRAQTNSIYVVEFISVSFSYQDFEVLEDVSLQVKKGEFLAVIGPNGAGKTTLLKLILGLLKPTSGKVLVFGKNINDHPNIRKRIGYVPQISKIDYSFPINVEDFVLTGRYATIGPGRLPHKHDRSAVSETLEKIGLQSLSTIQIGKLSGGQRQRILIARALINNPDMLILDEPTTAVDPKNSESLYELLLTLHQQGITILTVSHDIGVIAQYVDAIACVNRKVFVHDRPENGITDETLTEMYGREAAFFHHGIVPHIVVRRSSPVHYCSGETAEDDENHHKP
ncbi:MAG: High-affinity zinc uptake system ATP-binding protein ZnuC [Candidatus Atribacteria bacterium ADurb.Bin276]|uniref:High-affinity zinc uptake system ATP-binding protein ZnuC n=1 Tax=Candidatus Atribacter allofermentans TaxID=1852833 RepID=A0A1V5T3N9_9BACT|nr:MAG: High-affinity zinc uptake system ATP-binding protein ZnuC [Candidatus Atribacteria bacterium ADurb.Bin276]